jgi:hypothetical protein
VIPEVRDWFACEDGSQDGEGSVGGYHAEEDDACYAEAFLWEDAKVLQQDGELGHE